MIRKPYRIIFTDFPDNKNVAGMVSDIGSEYIILIDRKRSKKEQKHIAKHELSHILLNHVDDFWRSREEVEPEAEKTAHSMTDEILQQLLNNAISIEGLQ